MLDRENTLQNKKILIAMGGSDEFDFTNKIVKTIIKHELDLELNIVIGSGYKFKKELELLLKNTPIKYCIKHNVTDMLHEYLSCDIGIGAGGLTSSELIATKTPAILIALYEHQQARCEYFQLNGWAKYLGYREFNENDLLEALKNPIIPSRNIEFKSKKIVELIDEL